MLPQSSPLCLAVADNGQTKSPIYIYRHYPKACAISIKFLLPNSYECNTFNVYRQAIKFCQCSGNDECRTEEGYVWVGLGLGLGSEISGRGYAIKSVFGEVIIAKKCGKDDKSCNVLPQKVLQGQQGVC